MTGNYVLAMPGWLEMPLLILAVVFGFSAVIFVHELGHFMVAKFFGIRVERFAIGFGKRLWGFKIGETDYCINSLPLGGYVKMPGQEDFAPTKDSVENKDPRAFNNKPVGQRMAVVSAGVIMNVIFAAILFMIVFLVGVKFPPNRVGSVQFGSPAYAEIEPGWYVTAIGDEDVDDAQQLVIEVALSDAEDGKLRVVAQDGGTTHELMLTPEAGAIMGLRSIGVVPEQELKVLNSLSSAEGQEALDALSKEYVKGSGLKAGDCIVEAAGQPVQFYSQLVRICRAGTGRPVPIVVERKGDGDQVTRIEMSLKPMLPSAGAENKLNLLGAHPLLLIQSVSKKRPASGKLKEGDIVLGVADANYPFFKEFTNACESHEDEPLNVRVLRDGRIVDVEVVPTERWYESRVIVGAGMSLLQDVAMIGRVDDGSPLAKAGVKPGSLVLGVWGGDAAPQQADPVATTTQAIEKSVNWSDLLTAFRENAGGNVTLRVYLDGQEQTVQVAVPAIDSANPWTRQFIFDPPPLPLESYKTTYDSGGNPLKAAGMGMQKTWLFIKQAYITLNRLLFSDSIGPEHLTGPVGIADASYQMAKTGPMELLYFLALISANLAVINFLPLPIVDGGLFVFLIYEKIRKKSVSLRVIQITNYVGLVLIVSLFLFVTWQDILRLVGRLTSG